MVKVAITGNIGMGKSTVLELLREQGAAILDSDVIVSRLLDLPEVLTQIQALLGADVMDQATGTLDRKKVASIIFRDEARRKQYEALLHPMVYRQIEAALEKATAEVVVVEVPLLFETGHEKDFDSTITVYSDVGVAIDRMEQAGMTRAEAAERMMAQMPISDKVQRSTFTVDNNGDMNLTRAQVRRIMKALKLSTAEGRA